MSHIKVKFSLKGNHNKNCSHPSGELSSTGSALLSWLADDDNRELVDEIENVNHAMLDQLLDQSNYLASLFCE